MSKVDQAKTYKCKVPGCTYETTKEGYLTQHVAKKHSKQAGAEKTKKDDEIPHPKCPDCGGSDFEILDPHNQSEKYWIEQGYSKVCKKCQEVIK